MTDLDGKLTVLEAHDAADCPNRATCWAREIHDRYNGLDLGPIKALAEEYAGMDSGSARFVVVNRVAGCGLAGRRTSSERLDA